MNPISVVVWTLEENCWIVFSTLFSCFCYFLYVDRKRRWEPPAAVQENGGKRSENDHYSHKDTDAAPPDDEGPTCLVPALPADTPHVPYRPPRRDDADMVRRSSDFYHLMQQRRTVRLFSEEPVPMEVLQNIIKTAGTSPSGAHTEPWTFVVVQDKQTKEAIRDIVEQEEDLNYTSRMSRQWVTDLKPFKTTSNKPYLTEAPALVLVFRQTHSSREDGKKRMHYYSEISVAIAAGFLLAAIQYAGLVALTSTPLNCNARLRALLRRPHSERLELLLPVGRPHPHATVPALDRKDYAHIAVHL